MMQEKAKAKDIKEKKDHLKSLEEKIGKSKLNKLHKKYRYSRGKSPAVLRKLFDEEKEVILAVILTEMEERNIWNRFEVLENEGEHEGSWEFFIQNGDMFEPSFKKGLFRSLKKTGKLDILDDLAPNTST